VNVFRRYTEPFRHYSGSRQTDKQMTDTLRLRQRTEYRAIHSIAWVTRSQTIARIADRTASIDLWRSRDIIGHVTILIAHMPFPIGGHLEPSLYLTFCSKKHRLATIHSVQTTTERRSTVPIARPLVRSAKMYGLRRAYFCSLCALTELRRGSGGTVRTSPLFENMGLVIRPNEIEILGWGGCGEFLVARQYRKSQILVLYFQMKMPLYNCL